MNKIEILAPVGDYASVKAAVLNGADAIYLGATDFSARKNANNFSKDELIETVSYCHARNVCVHLAVNTVIFDFELPLLKDIIRAACEANVDAIIIQDLGVIDIVKSLAPNIQIHASTQMAVHTVAGAKMLQSMGISRVVLARELSLTQIKEIVNAIEIETEVFVHGALCMSVSGQCYISGMIGGRSGNRGNCAGTCRLESKIIDSDMPATPQKNSDEHALSLKDSCLIPDVFKLIEIGVTSLKIEGRMKRPEYVASAVNTLKKAISCEDYLDDMENLESIFSRSGFTNGYLDGKMTDMFGYRRYEDVISATNKIYKELQNTYKKEVGKIKIAFEFTAQPNEKAKLTAADENENSVTVFGEIPEKALSLPISEEYVSKSLKKLGGSIFVFDKLKCNLSSEVALSASSINQMRREALENLLICRTKQTPKLFTDTLPAIATSKSNLFSKQTFRARFRTFNQIPKEILSPLNMDLEFIILPIDEVLANDNLLFPIIDKIILEPDRVMFGCENEIIKKLTMLKTKGFTKIVAQNIAHIKIANDLSLELFGDTFLNCTNSYSANAYKNLGVCDQTISFETQIRDGEKIKFDGKKGIIGYGFLPLMIMKNCPVKAKKTCEQCSCNSILVDRMGVSFPIICNKTKYTEILNSTPLYMGERLKECKEFNFITLYFTIEKTNEISEIIDMFKNNSPSENLRSSFTRGLYYRSL